MPHGFHTGDGRRLEVADQPLRRDLEGRVELTGTSLAGVLRADLRRLGQGLEPCSRRPECTCPVCWLMGPEAPRKRSPDRETNLRASRLHVRGGFAQAPAGGDFETRIRDHVGIDRRTRTAAPRRKYDVELIQGAVEFPFELRLDTAGDEAQQSERAQQLLELVLQRLAGGWLFFGGKSAVGPGRAELVHLTRHDIDLAQVERLVAHLLAEDSTAGGEPVVLFDGGWQGEPTAEFPAGHARKGETTLCLPAAGQLRLRLELDFPWGLLVNDPGEAAATGFHHAFACRGDRQPLLPGSAFRGAVRSRGEQILRTLAGDPGACHLNTPAACHERIEEELAKKKGAFSFEEELAKHCPACRIFGSGRLASALKVSDFLAVEPPVGDPLRHEFVAIDRFTGGAAGGAKFDALASPSVRLRGEVHVDLGRLAPWGLGLLALVLRDLLHGDLPLGFATARGLNEYQARLVGIDRFWLATPACLDGQDALGAQVGEVRWEPPAEQDGTPTALGALGGDDLKQALEGWVTALHSELRLKLAQEDS